MKTLSRNLIMTFVISTRTFLVAHTVKHLSTMRETWVRSLGWEDHLEKEMAIHSSTIAWKIPWTEKPGRLQSMGSQRVRHDWATELNWGGSCCIKGCTSMLSHFLQPMDCSPPDASVHGNSPGKNTTVGCHSLLQGFSQRRNWILFSCGSCIGGQVLYY